MLTHNSSASLGRSQSLRLPASTTLKPPPSQTTIAASPSYVSLFITNLRLLNLDLRHDWPDITTLTFSTRDAQQNQKRRIQSVEWALYHLFAIWDPEETKHKLQPFFPPLEPLQSLNLRAALFRCLDTAKKTGVLGRDTVLRKTMLDECKGERLEEVLAVFSNVVLKKVVGERDQVDGSIARQLAYENFSYHGERDVLAQLILAHKVSLSKGLRERNEVRKKVTDFEQLLGLEDRRIIRKREQLKEIVQQPEARKKLSSKDAEAVRNEVRGNWAGDENWLEETLYGNHESGDGGLLNTRFEKVWKIVETGGLAKLEERSNAGLLDQLDARVNEQKNRLARWQAFGKQLQKGGPASPSKKKAKETRPQLGYNLNFDKHQTLYVGRVDNVKPPTTLLPKMEEYNRLVENLKSELDNIGKPRRNRHVLPSTIQAIPRSPSPVQSFVESQGPTIDAEDAWSSASGSDIVGFDEVDSTPITEPSVAPTETKISRDVKIAEEDDVFYKKPLRARSAMEDNTLDIPNTITAPPHRTVSPLPVEQFIQLQPPAKVTPPINHEAELADEILNSMAAASPSPKKRHTLSLAERTRLSMSRTTHSKFSDLHDEYDVPDISRLSIRSRPSISARTPSDENNQDKHADLIERTRKSMAGFEASQKKAQLERRRSVKDEKRKQRQSSYFPKVDEEAVVDEKKVEMMEGDPDYDSVFMSRPKIATSPRMSPERIMEEIEDISD